MKNLVRVFFIAVIAMMIFGNEASSRELSTLIISIEQDGDNLTPDDLNRQMTRFGQKSRAMKSKLEKMDPNEVSYITLCFERANLLTTALKLIKDIPFYYKKEWKRKQRNQWDYDYREAFKDYELGILDAIEDNKAKIALYTGSNVQTGSGENLVWNTDFEDIILYSIQKESMIDFFELNKRNDLRLYLEKSNETKSKQVHSEMQAHILGEVVGERKLEDLFIGKYAEENLEGVEAKQFASRREVLNDPKATLKSIVDTLSSGVRLMQLHLRYDRGIDMYSGKKVLIPLGEYETFMKVKGVEGTQEVRFYVLLPDDYQETLVLTEDMAKIRIIENVFTAESYENLLDNHFNKTQLVLPEYALLQDEFKKAVSAYNSELSKKDKESLHIVRQFHDVWVVLKAYLKVQEDIIKNEEVLVQQAEKIIKPVSTKSGF